MPTLDEQFEQWLKKERSADGHIYVTNGDAFLAGAAAEREAVLAIFAFSRQSELTLTDAFIAAERRIRQREEEGK